MRIIIVGGGIVGYSLADYLLKEKHRLCLVEVDPHLCQTISEKLDLQVINGSGSSPSVLRSAGISDSDMLLAVTPSNEVNIVACSIAAQHNVKQRIARLRGEEYAEQSGLIDLQQVGITSVIHPERVLVDQVLQFVETPHSVQSANFEGGKMLMRGYRVTEGMAIASRTPSEVRQQIAPETVLFAALVRKGVGMIPDGSTVIEPGDTLYSLFPRESLDRFLGLVGFEKKPSRKVIITGESYSTMELAAVLEDLDAYQVTFVDPDLKHAEQAAAQLSKIEVIHGDGTDADLLRELHVDRASFFIAVGDSPDYNMLSALLAKAEGAHEVIATTTDMRHNRLYNSIGIDHVINPRLTTAREILEIISRGHIGAVVSLADVDIQAVRFNVEPDSDVVGNRVRRIATKLKKGSIIGVIVREDTMILPHGDTIVEANDHVIVITHRRNIPTLSKLFKPRHLFKRG